MAIINYLYKTRPNFLVLVFCLASVGGFGFLARLIWLANWKQAQGISPTGAHIIILILGCIPAILSLACLYVILSFKLIYLTADELIITMPVFFCERRVLFKDMTGLSDEDETINISNRTFTDNRISVGTRTTVRLKNGDTVKISSMEVWGYHTLIKKLQVNMRRGAGHS